MEDQERTVSFFRFEDLRIYAKAIDYSTWVQKNLAEAKNQQEKTLAESFCRSSFDIALNIAEGSSRNKTQFEHYLKISKTAVRECIVFTAVAHNIGLLNEEQTEASREFLMELTRMIGALIISLQRGGGRKRENEDHEDFDNGGEEDALDRIDTSF